MFRRFRVLPGKSVPIDYSKVWKSNHHGNVLKPTSAWKSEHGASAFWRQVIEVSATPHPTLHLPSVNPVAAAQLFAALPLREKHIRAKYAEPLSHAKIETTMKKMGGDELWVTRGGKIVPDPAVYQENAQCVAIMPKAFRGTTEPAIDSFAGCFLRLCGFSSPALKLLTQSSSPFLIFGKYCSSKPEHLVVVTPNNDIVLVLEEDGTPGKFQDVHGYVGQVVGEMLMVASVNARLKLPFDQSGKKIPAAVPDAAPRSMRFHNIYALRFAGLHLTGFRLDVSKSQVIDVCQKGVVPKKKMLLRSTVADPENEEGWNLAVQSERRLAVEFAAAVLGAVK